MTYTPKKEPGDLPQSICILRLSSIGDVCHALAMVQQIQRQRPKAQITWIIGEIEATLVKNVPKVELIKFNKNKGLISYIKLYKTLNNRQFDVLLHMQTAIRASICSLFIRARRKIGFDQARAKEAQALFTSEKITRQSSPHVLDGFMAFAQHLGIQTQDPRWNIPIGKAALTWVDTTLGSSKYVVLSPSASNPERNWTVQNYCKLVQYLHDLGFTVVLTSGPQAREVNLAKAIQQSSATELINLASKTNLQELLAVISRACFLVAPDSGPVHMAVTANTPVIGIYAHSNPQRTGPYHYREFTVNHYEQNILQRYARPSSELPWGTRAKGKTLTQEISYEEVKQKVDLLMKTYFSDQNSPTNKQA